MDIKYMPKQGRITEEKGRGLDDETRETASIIRTASEEKLKWRTSINGRNASVNLQVLNA